MVLNTSFAKCPKCEVKYSYTDMMSGNTIGAENWSDGFFIAPMLMNESNFAKCPSCSTFFWLHDNSIEEPLVSTEVKQLENSSFLSDNITDIDFIKEAFRFGLANNPEKEIFLRIKLWQAYNHIIREYLSQGLFKKFKQRFFKTPDFENYIKRYSSYSSKRLSNLIRLANLLKLDNSRNSEYLLFAELYRETGDFSKAMIFCYKAETTSKVDPGRIKLLKQHIQEKDKMVYKL